MLMATCLRIGTGGPPSLRGVSPTFGGVDDRESVLISSPDFVMSSVVGRLSSTKASSPIFNVFFATGDSRVLFGTCCGVLNETF